MKKIFKFLTPLTAAAFIAGLAFTTACEDKTVYTFETNGGAKIDTVELAEGVEYTLPVPERTGYSFEGWYLTEDFSGEAVTTVTVGTDDATYYAKWEQLYELALELDGGSLSTTSVYLKKNENVYEAVKDLVPAKGDLTFGAWFDGNKELLQTKKMPAEKLTLTAKYKVEYVIEFYGQSLEDENDYTQKVSEDIVGYGYVGSTFTSEQSLGGFKEIKHDNAVYSVELSEDKTKNVIRHYFDRREILVEFDSNYPGATQDTVTPVTKKYGEAVEIPSNYAYEGYCLVGWSTTPNGAVEYEANYIATAGVLYNGSQEWTPETFMPETNTKLYAVWTKGYVDLFGGQDYLFLLSKDSGKIYLARGNKYFEGQYEEYVDLDDNGNEILVKGFSFVNMEIKPNGKTLLEGRLNANGTYVYYSDSRSEPIFTMYRVGVGLVKTDTIQFGKADEITYRATGEKDSKGTYKLDKNGSYEATFTEGPKAGTKMVFNVGFVNEEGKQVHAFNARNEDEYKMQEVGQLMPYNGAINMFYPIISLDGFGTATMKNSDGSSRTLNYTLEGDILTLTTQSGGRDILKIQEHDFGGEIGVRLGYALYNKALDQTFEVSDGVTLTLDGMFKAVYKNGEETVEAYYTSSNSAKGGVLVSLFVEGEEKYRFRITQETIQVPDTSEGAQPGATVSKVVFPTTPVDLDYVEYYYMEGMDKLYYAPLVVFGESENENEISVYAYNPTNGTFTKALLATYTYNETNLIYSCTVTEWLEGAAQMTDPINLANLKEFTFALASVSSYKVTYWYSYTTTDNELHSLSTVYNNADTEIKESVTFVAGLLVYSNESGMQLYSYQEKDGYVTFTTSAGTKYVVLNEEDNTFTTLDYAPYNLYLRTIGGTISENNYFAFSGKNGEVTYYKNGVAKPGTLEEIGATEYGKKIYLYTVTEGGETVKFIDYSADEKKVYSVYNESYAKEYAVGNGRLVLDGYGYAATYQTTDGTKDAGGFWVSGKVICVQLATGARYFDITSDTNEARTATLRGLEFGKSQTGDTYVVVSNQAENGWTIKFDGYNKYTLKLDKTSITGTYSINNGIITLSEFTYEDKAYTWKGEFFMGDKFFLSYENVVETYVHKEDWSVLQLDAYGNAVRYTKDGNKETGKFILLTDDLLYYENSSLTSRGIYTYDKEEGLVVPVSAIGKSYYSEDLEALQFTNFGLLIVDTKNIHFYNEKDGVVTVYRRPATGEKAEVNAYGFIEENFGAFADEVTYHEVTYYANSVYGAIEFKRNSTDFKLPAAQDKDGNVILADLQTLRFTPTGEAKFNVVGQLTIQIPATSSDDEPTTKNISCGVIREIVDGVTETYVQIATGNASAYYRIDVEVVFNGVEASSYEITAMKYVMEVQSYQFLDLYYKVYSMAGAGTANKIANPFGTIRMSQEYDALGNAGEMQASGELGEGYGVKDLKGGAFKFENASLEMLNNNLYVVEFTANDEYSYRIYFGLQKHSAFTVPGFVVVAFTRLENLTTDDGYLVQVGRLLATEEKEAAELGSIFSVGILKDEAPVGGDNDTISLYVVSKTKAYFVLTTKDGETVTAKKYYEVVFTEQFSGSVEDEGKILPYASVSVVEIDVQEIATKDNGSVDYAASTDKVLGITLAGKTYMATACEKQQDGSYLVTIETGASYVVVITEETAEEGQDPVLVATVTVKAEEKDESSEN